MPQDGPLEGGTGRKYLREHLVLRVTVTPEKQLPLSGVMVDVSIAGIKVSCERDIPAGTAVTVRVPELKLTAAAHVVRNYRRTAECLVALQFDEVQPLLTGKLVEYKVRNR